MQSSRKIKAGQIEVIPGAENFIGLTDTPSTYIGQATKKVVVKTDETGLEFVVDTTGVTDGDKTDIVVSGTGTIWLIATALKTAWDSAVTWISTNGASLIAHLSNTSNPHSTTKAQVGLSNVDNTADTAKPVSTAQQNALDLKLDKTALSETISASFNLSTKPTWNNREVSIDNGANNITITLNASINVIINKIGTGIITFAAGAGRTMETMTSTDEMIAQYSIARIFSVGTVDTLFINDDNDFAFIKKTNLKEGVIPFASFTGSPRTATVNFATNFPDTNYVVSFSFGEFLTGSVRVTAQTVSGFTIAVNQAGALTVDVRWLALREE